MTLTAEDHTIETTAAREAARDGYGWEDLVQKFQITEERARQYVWRAQAEQHLQKAKETRQKAL